MKRKEYSLTRTPAIPQKWVVALGLVLTLVVILASSWYLLGGSFGLSSTRERDITDCWSISRAEYGVNEAIFESLPPAPECFYTVVNAFRSGVFDNPFFFDKTYYLQPEFIPLFDKEGLFAWKNPSPNVWGAVGYGAHPYSLSVSLKPGQRIRTRFFMYSSFGIRTYQGMRVEPVFPNPVDASHVDVKVISSAANGFILGPNFPKFSSTWVRPVDIEITAQHNIPPETLRAKLVVKSPVSSVDEDGVAKYGLNYYPATAYVGERTPAELTITILPEE